MPPLLRRQLLRLDRLRRLSVAELFRKLRRRAIDTLSPRRILHRLLFGLASRLRASFDRPYRERPEAGPVNFELKMERVAQGGPFESEDIALLNRAAVRLVGDARRVLELGAGTGMFASAAARRHPQIEITASEWDPRALDWARENRSAPNIDYRSLRLEDCDRDSYDLVVAIELIEHLEDWTGFLEQVGRVAPRALLTTPNKNRSAFDSVADEPRCSQHVREWTAGEFYWILRGFFDRVELFSVPDLRRQLRRSCVDPRYRPRVEACGPLTRNAMLLAHCRRPRLRSDTERSR